MRHLALGSLPITIPPCRSVALPGESPPILPPADWPVMSHGLCNEILLHAPNNLVTSIACRSSLECYFSRQEEPRPRMRSTHSISPTCPAPHLMAVRSFGFVSTFCRPLNKMASFRAPFLVNQRNLSYKLGSFRKFHRRLRIGFVSSTRSHTASLCDTDRSWINPSRSKNSRRITAPSPPSKESIS